MRFSKTRPVKIVQLGAGGTGGHIAPHMYRLLYSLDRPVRYIICDGDIVEEKNLVRQNFTPADQGENKAKALAERYSAVFGLETEYLPSFVESEEQLRQFLTPEVWRVGIYGQEVIKEMVILLGAVDNNKSRQLCHRVFHQARELIYIDSGNGEFTGQVVCGIRQAGRTIYPSIGTVYPDVLEDTDKFPTELSCAEASVSAPQSMAANITAAMAVVSIVYNILALGESTVRQTTFSTKTVNVRPTIQQKKKRRKAA
nr:ThiF family adenylyltransferase [uncultured Oscillibacter sp.]